MLLRDSSGAIIFTACRHLSTCDNALESELSAISKDISLALQWSNLPIIGESDCLEACWRRLSQRLLLLPLVVSHNSLFSQ